MPRRKKLLIFLVLITAILIASVITIRNLHSFLSPQQPLSNAKILIVDAWLSDKEIDEAALEFQKGQYSYIVIPGNQIDRSMFYAGINYSSDLTALRLAYKRIPLHSIVPLHVDFVKRDRTYQSAITVKNWLTKKGYTTTNLNLFTQSSHARRSWLLYKKVFQNNQKVGIISAQPVDYDGKSWWRSSNGFRTVIGETIAYIYAVMFFHPEM